jgi:hypothetical protein
MADMAALDHLAASASLLQALSHSRCENGSPMSALLLMMREALEASAAPLLHRHSILSCHVLGMKIKVYGQKYLKDYISPQ